MNKIEFQTDKMFNIYEDNYIGFRAKWIVSKMRIQIFYPKDLAVLFVDRGTTDKFEKKRESKDRGFAEYLTKSILLRNQGYLIVLHCKICDKRAKESKQKDQL